MSIQQIRVLIHTYMYLPMYLDIYIHICMYRRITQVKNKVRKLFIKLEKGKTLILLLHVACF